MPCDITYLSDYSASAHKIKAFMFARRASNVTYILSVLAEFLVLIA